MFMLTLKLNKFKLAIACIAAALAIFLVVFLNISPANDQSARADSSGFGKEEQIVKTNDDRIAYLKNLGLEVSKEPVETAQVIIPKEFDDVFKKYNEIQKSSGFDLINFRNKMCTRYCYEVYNLSEHTPDKVRVNIFIYDGKVIAGDISSVNIDGFMVGLTHFKK